MLPEPRALLLYYNFSLLKSEIKPNNSSTARIPRTNGMLNMRKFRTYTSKKEYYIQLRLYIYLTNFAFSTNTPRKYIFHSLYTRGKKRESSCVYSLSEF